MKSSICSFILAFVIFAAAALPAATVRAQGADEKRPIVVAAQSDKQKRVNSCRARYRDCIKLNQIPSFECQSVYGDCINHIY